MHAKIQIERLIRAAYKKWKSGLDNPEGEHPDEEYLACFLQGRLAEEENERIRAHLITCEDCMEALVFNLSMNEADMKEVPEELISQVKELFSRGDKPSFAEIILKVRDKALEIISTTGDILVGQELIPAPVLRSRQIKDFKDEVTILKDFKDIRVEIRIENKGGGVFNLFLTVKQKESQNIIKDLRVMLSKDDLELESYLTDTGRVIFEHVFLGKYVVELSTTQGKLASILLEIKV